jgi:hypothetical protein
MYSADFRVCPSCAHADPIVVTIPGKQPAYVIARSDYGCTGPKQLPGVAAEVSDRRLESVRDAQLDGPLL